MMFGGYGGRDRNERGGGLELLVVAFLAPLAATLIQLAISRSREYDADKGGAELTGDPLSLASALAKISVGNAHASVPLTTNPATAHLFICNPLKAEGLMALFSTHPPTPERIKRLEEMAGGRRFLPNSASSSIEPATRDVPGCSCRDRHQSRFGHRRLGFG